MGKTVEQMEQDNGLYFYVLIELKEWRQLRLPFVVNTAGPVVKHHENSVKDASTSTRPRRVLVEAYSQTPELPLCSIQR